MRRLLLIAILALAAAASAIEPPAERERWISMTVGDLTVYSNAGDYVTRKIAGELTRMREALAIVTKLNVRSPFPTRVYVFADERSFRPYREALVPGTGAVGLFISGRGANFVLLRGDVGIEHVIYHELAHYFLRNTVADVPVWFNEGFAEFYSTFESNGDSVKVGRPVGWHVALLRSGSFMPLKDLVAVTHDSPDYHEGRRQGIFYAESWALVHYLLLGSPERRGQIGTFLGLLSAHRPLPEAFATAFHTTYDALEMELRAYIRRLAMPYIQFKLPNALHDEQLTAQKLSRDETLFALGDLLAHASPSTLRDANAMLEAAVRVNPVDADALADLGLVASRERRYDDADALFAKALAVEPKDDLPYLAAGWSLLDRHRDMARARQLFEKALALHPDSPRALEGIGETYVHDTAADPAPGIDALQRSLALAPTQSDVAYNLVVLCARAGRRADAEKALAALEAIGRPEMIEQARWIVARMR